MTFNHLGQRRPDPDDFTEAYDLDIDRVDLVGKAANGRRFLMLKAADGGLITPDTMRDLVAKEDTPMAKAKSAQVAVYDANGTLMGVVDPDEIQQLATPSTGGAQQPAQPPQDPAEQATQAAADDIQKALRGAHFGTPPTAVLQKSVGAVTGRYEELVKSLDGPAAARVSDAVALSALRFAFASGMPQATAVHLAKSIALDLAAAEARRTPPSAEAAMGALKAVHAARPTYNGRA